MDYKGYRVEGLGTYPMVQIRAKGQGTVPNILNGVYTTNTEAFKAIDMYLNSLLKGKRNGKTKDSSTD